MAKCLVYYGEGRASSWIGDAAGEVLANELKNKGFNIVNAVELRQKLEDAVRRNEAKDHVVVFTRDVVPHDVFDIVNRDSPQLPQTMFVNPKSDIPPEKTPYAETLLVKFLHRGGTVVWLGDVPFWYITNPLNPLEPLQLWVWPHINFFAVLGVFQVFNLISQLTYGDFADLGRWLSKRPVLVSQKLIIDEKRNDVINECRKKNGFIPLAKTFVLYGTITNWSIIFPDGSTYDMIEPLSKELQIIITTSKLVTEFNIEGGAGIQSPAILHKIPIPLKGEARAEYRRVSEREAQQMVAAQLSLSAGRPITGLFEAYSSWIKCIGEGLFIRLWDYEIRLNKDGNATVTEEEVRGMAGRIKSLLEKLGIKCSND